MNTTSFEVLPGDLVLIKGKAFTSRLIAFLIYTLFGIRRPWTHAGIVSDRRGHYLSAEASGVELEHWKDAINGARRWAIYRNEWLQRRWPGRELEWQMNEQAWMYLGKGYDYANYAIWFLRVSLVFAPLVWLVFQPLRDWLRGQERKRWMCSELTAQVYRNLGLRIGIRALHNAIPDDLFQIAASGSDWILVGEGSHEQR